MKKYLLLFLFVILRLSAIAQTESKPYLKKAYYDNGKLKSVATVVLVTPASKSIKPYEKVVGEWVSYYNNGVKKTSGFYNNGLKTGEWQFFYENGTLESVINYSDDKPTGKCRKYYKNGNLKISSSYKWFTVEGEKYVGKYESYHENGEKEAVGNYGEKGYKQGKWTYFYDNGKLKKTGEYLGSSETGKWHYYNEEGLEIETGSYARQKEYPYKSVKTGVWEKYEYFDNKQQRQVVLHNYQDDSYYAKMYYENGQLAAKGTVRSFPGFYVFTMNDFTLYHENGNIAAEFKKESNGLKFLGYYENKTLSSKGNIVLTNSVPRPDSRNEIVTIPYKKDGEWYIYYPNGQVSHVLLFKNDRLLELYEYYDVNGQPLAKGSLKNGNGTIKKYDPDGNYIGETEYVDGFTKKNK